MTRVRKHEGGSLTYEFEQLQPIQHHMMLVDGSADIEWVWREGDAHTGYSGSYEWKVTAIVINHEKEGALNLGGKYDVLYDWIEETLIRDHDYYIIEAIIEDENYIVDGDD
jgi:hypothetical protein